MIPVFMGGKENESKKLKDYLRWLNEEFDNIIFYGVDNIAKAELRLWKKKFEKYFATEKEEFIKKVGK